MGLFPVFLGSGRFERGTRRRQGGGRPAYGLLCALILGASGSALPIPCPSPAFAKGPDSLADLADSVSDAVVNISATQTMDEKHASNAPQLEPGTPFDDLFEEFFKRHQQGQRGQGAATDPKSRANASRIRSARASSSIPPASSSPTIM